MAKKLTEEHGMKFYDIHSLRHFNAKVLIHSGIDAAAVSSALGHSSISTTNIYCHAFNETQTRTGNAIAAAVDFISSPKEKFQKIKGQKCLSQSALLLTILTPRRTYEGQNRLFRAKQKPYRRLNAAICRTLKCGGAEGNP